jgi:hypothetical protein
MGLPEKSKYGFGVTDESETNDSSATAPSSNESANANYGFASKGTQPKNNEQKSKFGFGETTVDNVDSPVSGGLIGSAVMGLSGLKDALTAPPESAQTVSQDLEAASTAAKSSGAKWAEKTGYGVGEGTTRDVSQRYQKMMPKGRLARTYTERMGGTQAMRLAAEEAAANAAKEAELAGSFTNRFAKPIGQFLETPIKKAMAGFGTGFGALDAYNRYQQGDETGAAAAGLGALASFAQPYFTSPTSAVGRTVAGRAIGSALGPLGFAIPAYLTGRDIYRNSYLPVSSTYPEAGHLSPQAILAKQYPDNTGNPMAQP